MNVYMVTPHNRFCTRNYPRCLHVIISWLILHVPNFFLQIPGNPTCQDCSTCAQFQTPTYHVLITISKHISSVKVLQMIEFDPTNTKMHQCQNLLCRDNRFMHAPLQLWSSNGLLNILKTMLNKQELFRWEKGHSCPGI